MPNPIYLTPPGRTIIITSPSGEVMRVYAAVRKALEALGPVHLDGHSFEDKFGVDPARVPELLDQEPSGTTWADVSEVDAEAMRKTFLAGQEKETGPVTTWLLFYKCRFCGVVFCIGRDFSDEWADRHQSFELERCLRKDKPVEHLCDDTCTGLADPLGFRKKGVPPLGVPA